MALKFMMIKFFKSLMSYDFQTLNSLPNDQSHPIPTLMYHYILQGLPQELITCLSSNKSFESLSLNLVELSMESRI
jgi:hypothetical protein